MNRDVIRIIQIIEFRRAPSRLKRKIVRDWLSSTDPNVIAAAVDALLMRSEHIDPPLGVREVFDALLKNFELNLSAEKASTVYGTTCYQAARDLYSWLMAAAATHSSYVQEFMASLKAFLEKAYLAADASERECIQTGLLEHLFEHEPFRDAFEAWREMPVLGEAFRNAQRWSDWVNARIAALEAVAERTATTLRHAGYPDACLTMPSVGSAVVSVTWRTGELRFVCDDEWVKLAEDGRARLDDAVRFASEPRNWTADPTHESTFTVELAGAQFGASS